MSDLKNISSEDLLKEIKKRKLDEKNIKQQKALVIDDQIESLTPTPIANPDIKPLVDLSVDYITCYIKNGYVSEDYPEYFMEGVIQTIMGKDVYEKLRQIDQLKKDKKQFLK